MNALAPVISGKNISSPEMSNEMVVTDSTRSSGKRPGVCCIETRKFVSARFWISTPLGRPVEPDVYITYATSSGSGAPTPSENSTSLSVPAGASTFTTASRGGTGNSARATPSVSSAARLGVLEQVRQAIRRKLRVERHVRRSQLEHREHADHHRQRAIEADRDARPWPDAGLAQPEREGARGVVERLIRERARSVGDGHGVRRAARACSSNSVTTGVFGTEPRNVARALAISCFRSSSDSGAAGARSATAGAAGDGSARRSPSPVKRA